MDIKLLCKISFSKYIFIGSFIYRKNYLDWSRQNKRGFESVGPPTLMHPLGGSWH